MSTLNRSGQFIDDAVTLLDQADDIEHTARSGGDVAVAGRALRGEEALKFADEVRDSTVLPLLMSAAINLERIANALEAANSFEPGGKSLERFSTAEISAALAERLAGKGHPE